ncbi:MAG: flippase-like domain-containing protein [Thermodesulfovibrionales bacterium]|nr:flippase-like domain-containing protein [Thermodesulfovibrionales bacterium]
MNKKIITVLKIIFSCLLVLYLIWKSEPRSILKLIASANLNYIFPSFFLYLVIMILGAFRWKLLLSQIAIRSSFPELMKLTLLSQFGNVFIPGGFWGDIMRGVKIRNNGSRSKGIASVFIDRVLGAFGFVFIGCALLPFASPYLNKNVFMYILLLFLTIIISTILIFFSGRIQRLILKALSADKKVIQKMKQFYIDLVFQVNNERSILFKAFVVSLIASLINIVIFCCISYSLGNSASPIYFFLFIPIILVISHIPISYQGLGLREAGFILLFANAGLNRSQSLSISLVYFAIIVTVAAVSGMIYFVWNQFDKKPATI